MRQGSRPTIREVAASAGVSLATVSYVLSGRAGGTSRISPSTQERVRAAADELGYVPDRAARRMRCGRTGLVAIAVADLEEARQRALATAVSRILPRYGYQAVILLGESWRQFMLSGGADGVILASGADAGALAELARRGVAQLVIPDTGTPAGAKALAERAVALLLERLHTGTLAPEERAGVEHQGR